LAGIDDRGFRVLEDGQVTPLGATDSHHVDVRIVAATNADLPSSIAGGDFGRIFTTASPASRRCPPCAERVVDIPLPARHFLQLFAWFGET